MALVEEKRFAFETLKTMSEVTHGSLLTDLDPEEATSPALQGS